MSESWNVRELAIFSLEAFVFGVDSRQIQEIFSVKEPGLLKAEDAEDFSMSLSHPHRIPLLDLRQFLGVAPSVSLKELLPAICVSFYQGGMLWGTLVDSVHNILPASFHQLRAVPQILIPSAYKMHLWGFYEHHGTLIPLLELGRNTAREIR